MQPVDSDAGLAADHAQQAAVMHRIQQMGRRARRAAPVVRHRAEREMIVNLARVHRTANADELQQALDVSAARDAPRRLTPAARMHQAEHAVGHEAVVDEEVLMDVQAGVPALQIARRGSSSRGAAASDPARGPALESGPPARNRMPRAPSAATSVERGSARPRIGAVRRWSIYTSGGIVRIVRDVRVVRIVNSKPALEGL